MSRIGLDTRSVFKYFNSCMHTRRNPKGELVPLDPELQKTIRFNKKLKEASSSSPKEEEEVYDISLLFQEQPSTPAPQPMALTIRQLSTSVIPPGGVPTCITYPAAAEGATADFELKSGLLHRLPTFHGLSMEDPNQHLMEFQFICTSMKPQGADEQILKLKAFPFSLADKAKQWLYELPSGRITSWAGMMKAFLEKYFPTSRIIMLRKKISGIQQGQDESYAEYYERFKTLITQCPQHGMKEETLLTCFYDGLTNLERDMLDAASGGSFVDKEPAAGMILIENRALNQQQYGSSKSTHTREKAHEVSTLVQLEDKINKLTSIVSQGMKGQVMACGVCSMQGHAADQCPQLMDNEEVNAIGFQQGQNRPRNDPFSNTYNDGWRNHPNFRWRDNDNVQAAAPNASYNRATPGFYQKPQAPLNSSPLNSSSSSSSNNYNEIIKTLTISTQTLLQNQNQMQNQTNNLMQGQNLMQKRMEAMEKQLGHVVDFMTKGPEGGKLPSNTIPNPKGNYESANAITTRSGKVINAIPKKDESEKAILEVFKKVQINIPLLDALKQAPKYAKFLKELCTTRRHIHEKEVVKVGANVSALIDRKLPPKCKDPGSFTVPCVIGNIRFDNAMLDLGASINVMPYSVYASLGLGELKKDNVIIQLANRSNAYPKGLLEDVLVQVDKLIFPADFYVLEMEESSLTPTPLLLGTSFYENRKD
ncbi:uncharacterized protein LOC112184501 [Rosa chinensis]|uniref:uncharacterized protein LOC112184501 n=1 Tax=Rosa chinensis TaxID=74649 RepID=UPI000D097C34|nr:uncharacterized protein LOC112184501 [Rosa chinensis]